MKYITPIFTVLIFSLTAIAANLQSAESNRVAQSSEITRAPSSIVDSADVEVAHRYVLQELD